MYHSLRDIEELEVRHHQETGPRSPAKAEAFISDGIRHNPRDYRVYLERGVLYHRMKKWAKSADDLAKAERYWKNITEDSPYDLKAIHTYLKDARAHL